MVGALMVLPAAGLVLAGCGDEAASPATTAADRNAAGAVQRVTAGQKVVVARQGTTFVVVLRERPATGYQWAAAGGSAAGAVVELTGTAELQDAGEGPGGTALRRFTYSALKLGQGTLRFEYSRPWEDTPIDTTIFDVTVKGQ